MTRSELDADLADVCDLIPKSKKLDALEPMNRLGVYIGQSFSLLKTIRDKIKADKKLERTFARELKKIDDTIMLE